MPPPPSFFKGLELKVCNVFLVEKLLFGQGGLCGNCTGLTILIKKNMRTEVIHSRDIKAIYY